MNPTTVVSVRGLTRARRAELEADPNFSYVGRMFAGWPGSIFGNPFAPYLSDSVERFEAGLLEALGRPVPATGYAFDRSTTARFDRMAVHLPELRGKALGCWCCAWSPGEPVVVSCHAIVLARMADSLPETLEETCP